MFSALSSRRIEPRFSCKNFKSFGLTHFRNSRVNNLDHPCPFDQLILRVENQNAAQTKAALPHPTADVYTYERELEKLYPDNRHIKDKIRQQLQALRDLGFLLHVERDCWRLP